MKTAESVKYIPYKHEEAEFNPQNPHRIWASINQAFRRWRLDDPWDLLRQPA